MSAEGRVEGKHWRCCGGRTLVVDIVVVRDVVDNLVVQQTASVHALVNTQRAFSALVQEVVGLVVVVDVSHDKLIVVELLGGGFVGGRRKRQHV